MIHFMINNLLSRFGILSGLAFLFFGGLSCNQEHQASYHPPQYLILLSIDGYKHSYNEQYQPPNLVRFASEGVAAQALIPSFPSKTFPNHYTIVTGMYPENHNLVNNTFYDPERGEFYRIRDRSAVQDGSWYSGNPIWVHAEKHGITSASYFFVGSEADVQGVRPTYHYDYDASVPNKERIDQVMGWLDLPEQDRPRMITMYFSDIDDAGHAFGPDATQTKNAVLSIDSLLGYFFEKLEAIHLPVNFIIVSDHGMANIPTDHYINTDEFLNPDHYHVANNGALAHLYLKDSITIEEAVGPLNEIDQPLKVYLRKDFPHYHRNRDNPRIGDIILMPEFPYYLADSRRLTRNRQMATLLNNDGLFGEHGFDSAEPDMHGVFFAKGPAFKNALRIESFENIHIYPIMCRILGLEIPEGIDGDYEVLRGILKD